MESAGALMDACPVAFRQVRSLILVIAMAGCGPGRKLHRVDANKPHESAQTERTRQAVIVTGRVMHKPWTKTLESWDAGGGEYYVIQLDEPWERRRSMILRPSEAVPFEAFARYTGVHVRVHGRWIEPQPYQPSSDVEQYCMTADGKPCPRGSGFEVRSIERTIDQYDVRDNSLRSAP